MSATTLLADRFEEHRAHLKAVAYRLLGSLAEADDAVQQAWLRLARTDPDKTENLVGWLTTVVSRICLDMLRSRSARPEDALDTHLPDPIVTLPTGSAPDEQVVLADSVGLALQVVLDRLKPPERLAFVLHDMFAVPFEDVAALAGRTPDAVRQLASRARRRVADEAPLPDGDLGQQRRAADAFFAATRTGDFDALVAVLDPDVLLQSDGGEGRPKVSALVQGAAAIAERASCSGPSTPSCTQCSSTLAPVLWSPATASPSRCSPSPCATTASSALTSSVTAIASPPYPSPPP